MSMFKKKAKPEAAKDSDKPNLSVAYNTQKMAGKKMAAKKPAEPDSEVSPADLMSDDERASSVADAIMKKRSVKKMADGGMVELDDKETSADAFDDLNEGARSQNDEDFLKENYAEDFNTMAPEHEATDDHDDSMISKIRASMKAKRGI